jgi:hypothetical protein
VNNLSNDWSAEIWDRDKRGRPPLALCQEKILFYSHQLDYGPSKMGRTMLKECLAWWEYQRDRAEGFQSRITPSSDCRDFHTG